MPRRFVMPAPPEAFTGMIQGYLHQDAHLHCDFGDEQSFTGYLLGDLNGRELASITSYLNAVLDDPRVDNSMLAKLLRDCGSEWAFAQGAGTRAFFEALRGAANERTKQRV